VDNRLHGPLNGETPHRPIRPRKKSKLQHVQPFMNTDRTTFVVQRYLDELAGAEAGSDAELVISALLGRAAQRLERLCATLLYRSYPRLAQPPLGLEAEEMLGAVVERLLRALRETRPVTVRGFFALAGQHMRWELNDLARRLDGQGGPLDAHEIDVAAPATSESGLPRRPDECSTRSMACRRANARRSTLCGSTA
jgi:hypothetical protein